LPPTIDTVHRQETGNTLQGTNRTRRCRIKHDHQKDAKFKSKFKKCKNKTMRRRLPKPLRGGLTQLCASAGFYTAWLLPAAVVGTLVFVSGVMSMGSNTPA